MRPVSQENLHNDVSRELLYNLKDYLASLEDRRGEGLEDVAVAAVAHGGGELRSIAHAPAPEVVLDSAQDIS